MRHGFVEVTCESCDDARLVAFSCKGRGWCQEALVTRCSWRGPRAAATVDAWRTPLDALGHATPMGVDARGA
ncbi:MAG: hypothetical protein IT380_16400, partial [Myxococcales bacterium]|nr:hypothetical protein [Myxococcales bacterium]